MAKNLYIFNDRTTHHASNVKVTENRAPTDDSVRLLREMEQKALDSVTDRIKIEDNVFGEILVVRESFGLGYLVMFTLNGEKYKVRVDALKMAVISREELVRAFYETLAREIAIEITKEEFIK